MQAVTDHPFNFYVQLSSNTFQDLTLSDIWILENIIIPVIGADIL